ncbi:MAG TPA: division/cell wall cluster transcriptional repressor MraZ [Acidimicrobiia bacterium]
MFLGKAKHIVDEKGRLVLPSRFRAELASGCVITKGRDGSLLLFTLGDFTKKAEQVREMPENASSRRLARTFAADADYQQPDKQGRVLINEELRNFAGLQLGSEAAVLGVIDHVEVWNPNTYAADLERAEREYLDGGEEAAGS